MSRSGTEKTVTGCFSVFFFLVGLGAGITAFNIGAPVIFLFVSIGIGTLGLLLGIASLMVDTGDSMQAPSVFGSASTESTEHFVGRKKTSSGERIVYQVPLKCPECGANLNEENIEWVGPLKAQCPYCCATVEAEERFL
ncbi:MAG: hypothetical protein R6V83_13045 [Candidatus Thorarchaeota archaeon]